MGRQRIEHDATTTADPATVYALLRDGAAWPAWAPIESFELERPGADEPEGVGAVRCSARGRVVGRDAIAELVPDRRFSYTHASNLPIRDYRADVDLEPAPAAGRRSAGCPFDPKVPGTGGLLRRGLDGFVAKLAHGLAEHAARVAAREVSTAPWLDRGRYPHAATMDEPTETGAFEVGESFARILTETTQSLVCVLDRDGRILLFNEACERATGYRRDEVLGRDARDLVIPPEEREAFGEFLAYVWQTGTPSPQVGHWLTKQGRRRLIAWSNHPMAGADGTPAALVTTGIDLTDRAPPSQDVEGALAADPEAKLAEVGRLATEQRALRRVATLVASEVQPGARLHGGVGGLRAGARGQRLDRRALRGRRDGRRSSAATTATASTSSASATLRPTRHSAIGRVLATGAPGAGRRLGRARGRGRRGDVPHRLPLDRRRADRGRRRAVGRGRDRERGPAPARQREPARARSASSPRWRWPARRRARTSSPRAPGSCKAGDEQRRRLERNLHDGAQQRLVSVALKLRLARARLGAGDEARRGAARRRLAGARHRARGAARARPRAASRVLGDHGLLRALEALAARLPVPVDVDARSRSACPRTSRRRRTTSSPRR